MNQNDQMREALTLAYNAMKGAIHWDKQRNFIVPYKVRDPIHDAMKKVEQALNHTPDTSHVNETPKIEHDSDDVLKPAKLVRLTEMELWRNDELMALNAEFGLLFPDVQRFANAIMDAFLQKNGLDK